MFHYSQEVVTGWKLESMIFLVELLNIHPTPCHHFSLFTFSRCESDIIPRPLSFLSSGCFSTSLFSPSGRLKATLFRNHRILAGGRAPVALQARDTCTIILMRILIMMLIMMKTGKRTSSQERCFWWRLWQRGGEGNALSVWGKLMEAMEIEQRFEWGLGISDM